MDDLQIPFQGITQTGGDQAQLDMKFSNPDVFDVDLPCMNHDSFQENSFGTDSHEQEHPSLENCWEPDQSLWQPQSSYNAHIPAHHTAPPLASTPKFIPQPRMYHSENRVNQTRFDERDLVLGFSTQPSTTASNSGPTQNGDSHLSNPSIYGLVRGNGQDPIWAPNNAFQSGVSLPAADGIHQQNVGTSANFQPGSYLTSPHSRKRTRREDDVESVPFGRDAVLQLKEGDSSSAGDDPVAEQRAAQLIQCWLESSTEATYPNDAEIGAITILSHLSSAGIKKLLGKMLRDQFSAKSNNVKVNALQGTNTQQPSISRSQPIDPPSVPLSAILQEVALWAGRPGRKCKTKANGRIQWDEQKPYQCTLGCGRSFKRKEDWARHELTTSYPKEGWVCTMHHTTTVRGTRCCSYCGVRDPAVDHAEKEHKRYVSYHKKPLKTRIFFREDDYVQHFDNVHHGFPACADRAHFWIRSRFPQECGFCDEVELGIWRDRIDHIGGHFEAGSDMTSWRRPVSKVSCNTNDNDNDEHNGDTDGDDFNDHHGHRRGTGEKRSGNPNNASMHFTGDSGYISKVPENTAGFYSTNLKTCQGSANNDHVPCTLQSIDGKEYMLEMPKGSAEHLDRRMKQPSSGTITSEKFISLPTSPLANYIGKPNNPQEVTMRIPITCSMTKDSQELNSAAGTVEFEHPHNQQRKYDKEGSSLAQKLSAEMIHTKPHLSFLPKDDIDRLVRRAAVRQELELTCGHLSDAKLSYYSQEICSRFSKIFTILAITGKTSSIVRFLEERITDDLLPLDFSKDPPASPFNRVDIKKAVDHWSLHEVQDFTRSQWSMLAPVFEQHAHYNFPPETILPFIKDSKSSAQPGGYSTVWEVVIHPAHQNLIKTSKTSSTARPSFALKRLYSTEESAFRRESEMLKALAVRNHSHLIKLLATYKFQDRYHMLFPYAQSNLRQFWAENIPNKDQATNLWSLRQMYGIASGLDAIHNFQKTPSTATRNGKVARDSLYLAVKDGEEKYGRHGDLKPENILWFPELGDEPGGVLQIADLGLGRFHSRSSRSKVDPATVCTTPTYEAPEISLGQRISRAYDIWSLGCVFLEFVTWLTEGPTSVRTFQARLEESVGNGAYGVKFFDLEPDPDTGGRRAVVSSFVRTWIHDLREAHTSPLMRRLLDLVQDDMLVIDAESRCLCDDLAKKLESMISITQKKEVDMLGLTASLDLIQSINTDHSLNGFDRCEALPQCISPNYPYDTIISTKTHHEAFLLCIANAVKNLKVKRNGLQYLWAYSCCIDKSNSTKLAEVSNPMIRRYQILTKCYDYPLAVWHPRFNSTDRSCEPWESTFCKSEWFTRGWTLQKLIAPALVNFLSKEGGLLGNKASLERDICQITKLPPNALRGSLLSNFSVTKRLLWAESCKTYLQEDEVECWLRIQITKVPPNPLRESLLSNFSVAKRLLWAESCKTYLQEDEVGKAYLLLGIFDGNIWLIYS